MSQQHLEKLVHAFLFSRLDYCNGVFSGDTKRGDHITPVLRSLHWLPVLQRTDFRILLLVCKALSGLGPKHITDLLQNPSDHLAQVYCVALDPELNVAQQHLVSVHQISGTTSPKTAG